MVANNATNLLFSSTDMGSSFQSEAISLSGKIGFAIHTIFTGSPVGTFYISVSIDGTNWILLPDSSQAVSGAGDILFNVKESFYLLAKLHYTYSSGSGNAQASFSTKEAA